MAERPVFAPLALPLIDRKDNPIKPFFSPYAYKVPQGFINPILAKKHKSLLALEIKRNAHKVSTYFKNSDQIKKLEFECFDSNNHTEMFMESKTNFLPNSKGSEKNRDRVDTLKAKEGSVSTLSKLEHLRSVTNRQQLNKTEASYEASINNIERDITIPKVASSFSLGSPPIKVKLPSLSVRKNVEETAEKAKESVGAEFLQEATLLDIEGTSKKRKESKVRTEIVNNAVQSYMRKIAPKPPGHAVDRFKHATISHHKIAKFDSLNNLSKDLASDTVRLYANRENAVRPSIEGGDHAMLLGIDPYDLVKVPSKKGFSTKNADKGSRINILALLKQKVSILSLIV